MSGPSKREAATAYHEAGHAVVGLCEWVPRRLVRVSIIPDAKEATLGHTDRGKSPRVRDFERGPDGRPRLFYREFDAEIDDKGRVERRLKPRVISLFAGVLAEKRFTGHRHNWVGASDDIQWATEYIRWMTTSSRQAQKYTAYLWVVAEDTVARLWSNIEALAQELLTRKTMTAREVIAFQRAWRPTRLE